MAAAMTPVDPSADAGTASPASAAGDLSQGYCIELSVLPDGSYKVSGPEPLEEEAEEEQGGEQGEAGESESDENEAGQDFSSIGEALKGVLSIIKANPVGGSADDQLSAGFAAGK